MNANDYLTIKQLFEDYLRMYASRDDRLTTYFSEDFSGFTGGGDFLVKDRDEWVAITRQDFAQVKDPLRIELKDLAIQSLSDTIAVTTGFFTIHLPIKDHILSREIARLVLIFRKESGGWKITHSSISIPYYLVRAGEIYPLKELADRNQKQEEAIAERTMQLSEANDRLQQTNKELAKEIAEHKQALDALQQSNQKIEAITSILPDGIGVLSLDGKIQLISDKLIKMHGYSIEQKDEYLGRPALDFIDPSNHKLLIDNIHKVMAGERDDKLTEYLAIKKDNSRFNIDVNSTVLRDSDGNPTSILYVERDITERKRIEEALLESEQRYRELSMVDSLTQLYNSRHFYVQLKSEIERSNRYGQPLTLLLLDLDNFKAFNDAYGHVEGDHVLLRLGQVVKRCLRETDSAYRYGGEEFTILLPMTTSRDGVVTAERIRTEFQKEIFSPMSGQEVHVTVSIGLGQYKTKEEMKAFVHRVDQLMYQGKKSGKDRVCCES
ncbi:MAG: diguanylate cyclase [Desulfofustis sp.]|nr:diguanylate cyclase [Desulfofustis sp.]